MALLSGAGQVRPLQGAVQLAVQLLLVFEYTTSVVHAQPEHFAQTKPRSAGKTSLDFTSGVSMFTFHGPIRSDSEADQVEILLHVLLKTKRQDDGTFVVRTVSYTERVEPQGIPYTPHQRIPCIAEDCSSHGCALLASLCSVYRGATLALLRLLQIIFGGSSAAIAFNSPIWLYKYLVPTNKLAF